MRWLVLLLVVANLALFFWFSTGDPGNVRSVDEGRLPRVSEIELIDQQSVAETGDEQIGDDATPGVESPPVSEPALEEAAESVGQPREASRQCFVIDGFEEEFAAQAYREQLSVGTHNIKFVGITEQVESLEPFHWVIVPPLETRDEALQRYRELVNQGVEAYVVPSGERENAISLGLFRSLQSAEGVLRRRQAQNINAILVKFPRNRISYALVFEGVAPSSLDDFGGASAEGGSGLQLIEISDCEGVATAEKNP
ncbi:hypothetical protein ACJO2E_01640 [Marinobacter sp. M1N3S26]|uniref:hypothetical protein n=1 Tax=unclassified Marinobacter TaxID=83889 RepID=UPI00387AEE7D